MNEESQIRLYKIFLSYRQSTNVWCKFDGIMRGGNLSSFWKIRVIIYASQVF
jgi:hypothetical protein